jgi:hypothetical protein
MDFKEFLDLNNICEGISISGDQIIFDYKNKKGVSTKFGKAYFSPLKSKNQIYDVNIYSVYKVKNEGQNVDILKTIKYHTYKGIDVNNKDYQYFIKRTSIFMSSKILKDINPEIIITPKSTSLILNDLLDQLKLIMPHVKFLSEKFQKVIDPDKIIIDRNNPKITQEIINRIEGSIRRAKKEGYFQIKWIDVMFRKFVQNFFELIDDYNYIKIQDKNIVLIDDIYTSGTSLNEMIRILKQYSPSNLTAISIFKM